MASGSTRYCKLQVIMIPNYHDLVKLDIFLYGYWPFMFISLQITYSHPYLPPLCPPHHPAPGPPIELFILLRFILYCMCKYLLLASHVSILLFLVFCYTEVLTVPSFLFSLYFWCVVLEIQITLH